MKQHVPFVSADNESTIIIVYAISTLQRVYSRVRDGSIYQQWRINECRPWINLIHPATGEFEVLDGADNESKSMQGAELCP